MSLAERNSIVPQMDPYDRIGEHWVPYLMRFHLPNKRYWCVSTDEHGFRSTTAGDGRELVRIDAFREGLDSQPRGVLLGSSAAFGVGATHDRFTVPSVLNARTATCWFNYGGRAYNSTQELLLLLLYLPRRLDKLVVLSGVNNLTLAYLSEGTSPVYNSFFGQSVFERAMEYPPQEYIGLQLATRRFVREWAHKLWPRRPRRSYPTIDARYSSILACFERDLEVLSVVGRATGCEVYFAFQPLATWIDKRLTREERDVFAILDRMPTGDWLVLAQFLDAYRRTYVDDVRRLCDGARIPFLDLNTAEDFAGEEWLFVDRVHLTDRGYALVAEHLQRAFGL